VETHPQFDLVCWWQRCIRWLCIKASSKILNFVTIPILGLPSCQTFAPSIFESFVSLVCTYFWFELGAFENNIDDGDDYVYLSILQTCHFWMNFSVWVTHKEELGVLEVSADHLRWTPKVALLLELPCSESVRTLGQTYGIKARCYWEHPWGTHWEPREHIENLIRAAWMCRAAGHYISRELWAVHWPYKTFQF
jgi:hypothetical protein